MSRLRIALYVFIGLLTISCNPFGSSDTQQAPPIVILQPFRGFPLKSLTYVEKKLLKSFPKIQINKAVDLPAHGLNVKLKRYVADTLVNYLSTRTKPGYVTVGFTTKDICATMKGKGKYWGIFGLGRKEKRSCIVSTFRLKGKNKLEKLYKLTLHEIGHTQGLYHCPNDGCYMRDAKGKDHLNQLKDFCPACKIKLHWLISA